jgi:uncharacterized membrane protein
MSLVNTIAIPTAVFVVLEGVFWFVKKNYINKMFDKCDSCFEPGNIKMVPLVIHYLIELFAIIYFLILGYASIYNSFVLGFVIHASKTSMNYATIKDYNINYGTFITVSQSILFALTVYLSRLF